MFYFHVLSDQTPDLIGTDLASAGAARREAIRAAGQILLDGEIDIQDGVPWMMRVTDDKGGVVCNLRFSTDSGESTV